MLASRWDANRFPFSHPVVSLVPPVVSLHLTTGYRLRSRWDQDGQAVRNTLLERGIRPESLPPEEDIKKVERRLTSEEKKNLKNPDILE